MKINVIDRLSINHQIDADVQTSLLTAITQSGMQDSFGICGGACGCSSCQVYIDEEKFSFLSPMEEMEKHLLEDMAHELRATSRLACQIILTQDMEDWTFTIAPY